MSAKLTTAQVEALHKIERRKWPAGEPRLDWFGRSTANVLMREGLIELRPHTAGSPFKWSKEIVDLTDAGRAAIANPESAAMGGEA